MTFTTRRDEENRMIDRGSRAWLTLCALSGVAMALTSPARAQVEELEAPQMQPQEPAEEEEAPPRPAPQAQTPTPTGPASGPSGTETVCDDRQDNDGDGLADCADADCFGEERCQAGGQEERNNDRCSDWIDNDGDGAVDCEDQDCTGDGITVCSGSWSGQSPGDGAAGNAGGGDEIPELTGDMSVEDLIGRAGDADGERDDYVCSDGVDNDGDGRTDCSDFGCRFDPSVTVCSSSPGIRFSVVAGIAGSLRIDETPDIDGDGFTEYTDPLGDVRFTRIQLRALGPIPFIQNSFFLINLRAERTLRMTFATFNIPLGNEGHYLSLNSGSGGLSPGLIVSTSKQPLLDPPFYLFNAFEQGNGAALEVGGPITSDNMLRFRVFAAGGSGEFNGNVGGRFFRSEDRNFSYSGGAQLRANLVGHSSRFDTPFLYTEVPMALALVAGARWDQRPVERYVAWNVFALWRFWHLSFRAESYSRYVLDFDGIQTAWNFQASILLVPRTLMAAFDVGGFFVGLPYDPAVVASVGGFSAQFREPVEEFLARVALHWYYFRNIGIMSLLYGIRLRCAVDDRMEANGVFGSQCLPSTNTPEAAITEHEIRLEAQFRF
ncbi:MAG: hypothetical protein R3266_10340 [Gemmatimonadota bacterium]|nr:hypothetical protein [Gemmatimonadota bacterium]